MKIYVTYRNSDTTEGRGPMVSHKAFVDEQKAIDYIDTQPGIMGRMAKWSEEKYGDWEIRSLNVIE